jgi:hypothetical protein
MNLTINIIVSLFVLFFKFYPYLFSKDIVYIMVNYAVLEITSNNTNKSIIANLNSPTQFIDYLKTRSNIDASCAVISGVVFTTEKLSIDNSFDAGKYLIINGNTAVYLEKINKTVIGYFSNSIVSETRIIASYELIPYEFFSDNESESDFESDSDDQIPDEKLDITLKTFDIRDMYKYSSSIIIAKRGLGKSTFISSILETKSNEVIRNTFIISPKDKLSPYYVDKFPAATVYHEYKSHIIANILDRQSTPDATDCVIILDDCLLNKDCCMKDKAFCNLLFNSKHLKITFFLAIQYPLKIVPELRSNFDYVFLGHEDFETNLKRLYDNYAGMFPTFESFKQVFEDNTKNYSLLTIINHNKITDFEDKVKVTYFLFKENKLM